MCTYRSTDPPRRFRSFLDERGSARRAPVSSCLYPCPRTHGEIRGRNGPGRRARDPTLIGIDKKSTYNADNITPQQQQSSTRYICCIAVYIHRAPAVARPPPFVFWLYTAVVPELICIAYVEQYVRGMLLQVLVYLLCTYIARPPSLARRRSPAAGLVDCTQQYQAPIELL